MENPYVLPLSLLVFLPTIGAFILLFFRRDNDQGIKFFTLIVTMAVFLLTVYMALPAPEGVHNAQFSLGVAKMQNVFQFDWIPSFNIQYYMGIDGISFPLLLLTSFISMLSMAAAWPINKHVKAFCVLFLLLETGMLGVFMALDFFLFYVF